MQIQFKGTNYELNEKMTDLATRKLERLKKYLGKREKPALAYVDLGRYPDTRQNGAVWYADTNLDVDGVRYYAKAEADSLRTAVDRMIAELSRELIVAKKKRESMARKGGMQVKRFFADFRNA